MTYVDELLATAEKLLQDTTLDPPTRSDCNRAVSTAYYACFHHICSLVADRIAGLTDGTELGQKEWTEVFRSITHASIIQALIELKKERRDEIGNNELTLKVFKKLHTAREDADYNALKTFDVLEAKQLIREARDLCGLAFDDAFELKDARGDLTFFIRRLFSIKPKAVTK